MFHIVVDSMLRFIVPPEIKKRWPGFLDDLRKAMVIPNPAYAAAERHGRSTYNIPRDISLWNFDRETSTLILPRAYLPSFLRLLEKHRIFSYKVDDRQAVLPPVDFGSRIRLRDYQVPAVEALVNAGGGILQAPAGSGKTQMGLEIIARLGQPSLWLTHTRDLAEQAITRASQVLSLKRREIGLIGAGRESVGDKLTVGIIAKMSEMDLSNAAHRWGTVVVDETHHTAAPTWAAIVNQLPARYRYGVTATPERADGLDVITERVIGPVIYYVSREAVKAAGGVVTPRLRTIDTGCRSEAWEQYEALTAKYRENGLQPPPIPFARILDEVLNDADRNRLIVRTVAREAPGHTCLVLSERVSHCETLEMMLNDVAPRLRTAVIHGKLGKNRRQEILNAMNAGRLDVLFAVDIAKEGLDVPRLDRLFLVAGGRNATETEQKVGRIQRSCPGKRDAVVFDFVDEKIGCMRAQFFARRRVYKELGMISGGSVAARKRASG